MSDENENVQGDVDKLDAKKVTISLLTKLGSGVVVLGVLGYAASWAFVTLNTLQEGQVKNAEKLEMIEKGVEKDREDKAQWKQIMILRERSVDNEVELRVLKELYKFRRTIAEKKEVKEEPPQTTYSPYMNPMPALPLPQPPKKKDHTDLYKKLMERKNKKLETIDDFKHKSIQQIQKR